MVAVNNVSLEDCRVTHQGVSGTLVVKNRGSLIANNNLSISTSTTRSTVGGYVSCILGSLIRLKIEQKWVTAVRTICLIEAIGLTRNQGNDWRFLTVNEVT